VVTPGHSFRTVSEHGNRSGKALSGLKAAGRSGRRGLPLSMSQFGSNGGKRAMDDGILRSQQKDKLIAEGSSLRGRHYGATTGDCTVRGPVLDPVPRTLEASFRETSPGERRVGGHGSVSSWRREVIRESLGRRATGEAPRPTPTFGPGGLSRMN